MNIFNKIIYSSLVSFSFFVTSCSNDNDKVVESVVPVVVEPVCQITSYTDQWFMGAKSADKLVRKFVYDAKGRIIIAPEGSSQISFEYYDNQIIVKYSNPAPNIVTDYYTLDNDKKITHLVRKAMNSFSGDTEIKDYVVLDFEYNQDKQLAVIKEGNNKATFTYLNGNLVEMHDGLNGENKTYNFSYNMEEQYQNLFLFSLSPIYHLNSLHRIPTPSNNPIGMAVLTSSGYFGKSPKNQIKSINTYSFTYKNNESNKIINVEEKNSEDSIDYTEYTFEYLCK